MANCDITSHNTEYTIVQLRCSIRRTDIQVWIEKVTSSVPNGGLLSIAPKARYTMYGVHRWHRGPRGVNNGSQHLTHMNQLTFHMSHIILQAHLTSYIRTRIQSAESRFTFVERTAPRPVCNLISPTIYALASVCIGIAMQNIIMIYIRSPDMYRCLFPRWTTHKSVRIR